MRGDLDEVFAGVGTRRLEIRDDGFIQLAGCLRGVLGHWLIDFREPCRRMLQRMPQAHQRLGYGDRMRTREPHDANASAARRRGDGHDGFVRDVLYFRKLRMRLNWMHEKTLYPQRKNQRRPRPPPRAAGTRGANLRWS